MPTPLIIAHRGASHAWPENTAAAFDAALDEGADGIELDLQLTADGVVAVFHDHGLDKLGLARRHVSEYRWDELRRTDAGRWFAGRATKDRILRLEDVLEGWARRTRLYLEVKNNEGLAGRRRHRELARRVAREIEARGLNGAVEILSFHDSALQDIHAVTPDIPLVRNLRWSPGLRFIRRMRLPLAAVCVAIERFGPRHAPALEALGLPRYAYTCDDAAAFRRALALGVDKIISNRPAAARDWLMRYA
jgi:glycerophosphoryl diester phosphodiesterase